MAADAPAPSLRRGVLTIREVFPLNELRADFGEVGGPGVASSRRKTRMELGYWHAGNKFETRAAHRSDRRASFFDGRGFASGVCSVLYRPYDEAPRLLGPQPTRSCKPYRPDSARVSFRLA